MSETRRTISLALTGASGAPYALRLLSCLLQHDCHVFLMISSAAKVVLKTEAAFDYSLASGQLEATAQQLVAELGQGKGMVEILSSAQWLSPVASGSAAPKQMVICPCSMGTVSAIAHGSSDNLIERAADVVLKEKGQLIVVPREMPFSALHLKNLTLLAEYGATIMPACPGFYHQPESIDDLVDFVVARILDHLGFQQGLVPRWGYQP